MAKSKQRFRTYVVFRRALPHATCRTCKEPIIEGTTTWSPYYQGGWYHPFCEAIPARMPPAVPDPDLRCPECGWFRRTAAYAVCARCHLIAADAVEQAS